FLTAPKGPYVQDPFQKAVVCWSIVLIKSLSKRPYYSRVLFFLSFNPLMLPIHKFRPVSSDQKLIKNSLVQFSDRKDTNYLFIFQAFSKNTYTRLRSSIRQMCRLQYVEKHERYA